jgi:hypothetical protein
MGTRYAERWWSVDLPAGWSGEAEGDTALIAAENGCGLLQIRSFRSDGRDIEDDDLKDLASEHRKRSAEAVLHRARYGAFSGFYVYYRAEAQLWYEWWLRSGRIALHATYHCDVADKTREEATVAAILGSLRNLDRVSA